MVSRNAKGITRRQLSDIRITILYQILGTRHGAFKQARITHAIAAAMFCKLLGMRRYRHFKSDPNPLLRQARYLFG